MHVHVTNLLVVRSSILLLKTHMEQLNYTMWSQILCLSTPGQVTVPNARTECCACLDQGSFAQHLKGVARLATAFEEVANCRKPKSCCANCSSSAAVARTTTILSVCDRSSHSMSLDGLFPSSLRVSRTAGHSPKLS